MGMENVKYIKLSNYDGFAVVDEELHEEFSKHKWRADFKKSKIHRVCRDRNKKDPAGKTKIFMHQAVISVVPVGMVIDHINHNTLDNRKTNLRVCTVRENALNSGPSKNNRTQYKGVTMRKLKNDKISYVARIENRGVSIYIGVFDTPEKAARAYNKKAKELFGEFAYLNDVPEEACDAEIQANQ